MIVQSLRDIQNTFGYLPDDELRALAIKLGVPLARIEEVTSFFPAFRPERDKPAAVELRVCRDMSCHRRGAVGVTGAAERVADELNAAGGDVRVEGISCLGRCDRAPAAWVECHPLTAGEHAVVYTDLTEAKVASVLRAAVTGQPPTPDTDATHPPPSDPSADPPSPPWEIDVYARNGWPRDYRGVQGFVGFLTANRLRVVPRPPAGTKEVVANYVRDHHPWLWRLSAAKLGGMGGALASVYQKWFDVWEQRSAADAADLSASATAPPRFDKYVVANGDESEPGTFKDREVMLRLPHLLVEGVILAGLMVGASAGYVFIRHEYPEQIAAVQAEIRRAESIGACGASVFGSGRAFPVTVVESPGGYICGEQSALLEAMEDRRGQPRNKPPEITANGFRDRPTVLNNVETLSWIPHVMLAGADKPDYPSGGWKPPAVPGVTAPLPRFGGRRLFSVSGDVNRPGVYEVPIGLPLGTLLTDPAYCGGLKGPLKAVATSGPSGGLLPARMSIPPRVLERFARLRTRLQAPPPADAPPPTPLTFEEWFVLAHVPAVADHVDLLTLPLDKGAFDWLKSSGIAPLHPLLGAGLVVYAGEVDVLDQAINFSRFFRNESCGKCVPCRIGTEKLVQLGTRLAAGRTGGGLSPMAVADAERDVADLTLALTQTSICSLGGSAPNPLASTLTYFPDELKPDPQ